MKTSIYSLHKSPPEQNSFYNRKDKSQQIVHKISLLSRSLQSQTQELSKYSLSELQKYKKSFRYTDRKIKNMTCINLGIQNQDTSIHNQSARPSNNSSLINLTQEAGLQRNTQRKQKFKILRKNTIKSKYYDKLIPKPQYQKSTTKFNFLFPNEQKKSLLKFQKKLLSILYKKKQEKFTGNFINFNSNLKTVASTQKIKQNLQSNSDITLDQKAKNKDKKKFHHIPLDLDSSRKNSGKQNQNNFIRNQSQKNLLKVNLNPIKIHKKQNSIQFNDNGLSNRAKLFKQHFKNNSSAQLSFIKQQINGSSANIHSNLIQKQNRYPKETQAQYQKYQNKILLTRRFQKSINQNQRIKFKKLESEKTYYLFNNSISNCKINLNQLRNGRNTVNYDNISNHQTISPPSQISGSFKKLKNISKTNHKKHSQSSHQFPQNLLKYKFPAQEKQLFTPWQSILSQKQIFDENQ